MLPSHLVTPLMRTRLLAGFLLAALALALAAGSAHASVTALEKKATDAAYSQLGVYEPYGNNDLPGAPAYELNYGNGTYGPWCGSFVNWVMKQAGINPQRPERGGTSFNVNVARAWSVYGPQGGGYGRYASAYNAMPGDLLVYGYDGTTDAGTAARPAHVTMVVAPVAGDPRYVWTIGGNESDAVRLQKRDLAAGGTYLVTLLEFRTRRVDLMREINTQLSDVGDVYFKRYYSNGARLQVTQVQTSGGSIYNGTAIDSAGYRTQSPLGTYAGTQIFGTDAHSWIHLYKTDTSASLAAAGTSIDYSRATVGSGVT